MFGLLPRRLPEFSIPHSAGRVLRRRQRSRRERRPAGGRVDDGFAAEALAYIRTLFPERGRAARGAQRGHPQSRCDAGARRLRRVEHRRRPRRQGRGRRHCECARNIAESRAVAAGRRRGRGSGAYFLLVRHGARLLSSLASSSLLHPILPPCCSRLISGSTACGWASSAGLCAAAAALQATVRLAHTQGMARELHAGRPHAQPDARQTALQVVLHVVHRHTPPARMGRMKSGHQRSLS